MSERRQGFWALLPVLLTPVQGHAAGLAHGDPVAPVIMVVTTVLICAVFGRYLARLFNQPGVLGELVIGIILGNLCYFFGMQLIVILREGTAVYAIEEGLLAGKSLVDAVKTAIPNAYYANQVVTALSSSQGPELIKIAYIMDILSRYGIIFLLFMVGLESSVHELRKTGRESLRVALIGVMAPMIFGFIVAYFLLPEASLRVDIFVAATLSATSIGITAGVLKEMKKLKTREARTILGAAMIDDILGLIILAVVSSLVLRGEVDLSLVVQIIFSALLFFVAVLYLGPKVLAQAIKVFRFLELWEIKLFISLIFIMGLAWLAAAVNLATIIGAFAAGLIIHEGMFEDGKTFNNNELKLSIKNIISPLESILAPLFFILIGIQVKLESFYNWQVLFISLGLIIAAVIGKLVSGLGANARDDRWLIGIGMLPRGEVGLVFAAVGRTLGIMSDQLFSAIILMIIVTTLAAPPLLKMRFNKPVKGMN